MIHISQLEDFLEPGIIIETKHKNANDWVVTEIVSCFADYIELRQVEDYLTSVVMLGDKLLCRIITPKTIYIIRAEVYNVKFASRTLILKAYKLETVENTRTRNRYDVYLSSSIKKVDWIGEEYSVVVNISVSGLSLITKAKLDIDDKIQVSIYFKGFQNIIAECSIRWKGEFNENPLYGLSIDYMDEISDFKYKNFIKKVQRKEMYHRKKGKNLLRSKTPRGPI